VEPAFPVKHFFAIGGPMAATITVMLSGDPSAPRLVLTSLTIGAAALVAMAMHRTLWPLVRGDAGPQPAVTDGRPREALAREKLLVLRSLKELEFDFSMGKLSAGDYQDMSDRLRSRALGLMRALGEP
jgi:hypothetical protein